MIFLEPTERDPAYANDLDDMVPKQMNSASVRDDTDIGFCMSPVPEKMGYLGGKPT